MTRRILALVAVFALGASGVALAAKQKGHAQKGGIRAHVIAAKGNKATIAGTFSATRLGRGAVVYRVAFGLDSSGGTRVSGRVAVFTGKGTLKGHITFVQNPAVAGVSRLRSGSYSLGKGTGRLKGVTAKGSVHGSQAANGNYALRLKGRVR